MVENNLLALSKQVPDISSFVLREIAAVNKESGRQSGCPARTGHQPGECLSAVHHDRLQ